MGGLKGFCCEGWLHVPRKAKLTLLSQSSVVSQSSSCKCTPLSFAVKSPIGFEQNLHCTLPFVITNLRGLLASFHFSSFFFFTSSDVGFCSEFLASCFSFFSSFVSIPKRSHMNVIIAEKNPIGI